MAREAAQTCQEAALTYQRLGWSVIPLQPGEKFPIVPWREFQDRRADETEIRSWFSSWPRANVGLVTGAISGFVVLDVDPRHDGEDSLAHLVKSQGALPDTVEALTGGGGRHFYFASRDNDLRNRVAIMPGIDLRARGGMVVAPPVAAPLGAAICLEARARAGATTACAPAGRAACKSAGQRWRPRPSAVPLARPGARRCRTGKAQQLHCIFRRPPSVARGRS